MDTILDSPIFMGSLTVRLNLEALALAALVGVLLSLSTHYLFYGRLRSLYRPFAIVTGLFCTSIGWGANWLMGLLQVLNGVGPGPDQHWPAFLFWACLGLGIALGMALGYDLHMALFHGRQVRLGSHTLIRLPDWRKDNPHGYR